MFHGDPTTPTIPTPKFIDVSSSAQLYDKLCSITIKFAVTKARTTKQRLMKVVERQFDNINYFQNCAQNKNKCVQ